jgi:sugar-specific transcriptional regulator TrmB
MVINKADIETLNRLGLTLSEAKVYLALTWVQKADVKEIARSLDTAKCEVYRVISSLEKVGLVEKILAIPSAYKTIPVEEATQILLHKKTEEYNDLQKKTMTLVANLYRTRKNEKLVDEENKNIIISEGKIVGKRLVNQLLSTQKSFETMSTWSVSARMLTRYSGDLKQLIKNKVKIRVLTDKVRRGERRPAFLDDLQSDYFEIRYHKNPIEIKMAIRDKSEVNVCLSAAYKKGPNAWSNNLIFAQLATNCFEYMWNEAAIEQ